MSVPICNRFHATRVNSSKKNFLGVHLFDALVQGEPPHPAARNFATKNYSPWGSSWWRFRDPSLLRFDTDRKCDRQTDRQTDA